MIRHDFLSFSAALMCLILSLTPGCLTATIPVAPKNREPPCTASFDWLGSGIDTSDCAAAINKFYDFDVARYGSRDFEFKSVHKMRRTPLPPMVTPRRYTVGER